MEQIELLPYIFFKGNARQAFEFYKSVFGGQLEMQTLGEAPAEMQSDEFKDRKDEIMHARLFGGAVTLLGSDSKNASQKSAKIELSLNGSNPAELEKIFDKLGDGGKVRMKLSKQFWGATFGMVTDKFGVDWMVSIETKK